MEQVHYARRILTLVCLLAAIGLACTIWPLLWPDCFMQYSRPMSLYVLVRALFGGGAACVLSVLAYRLSPLHPLSRYPGPVWNRLTELPLAVMAFRGTRHVYVRNLHRRYGRFVRIAPDYVSINSSSAVHAIHSSAQCLNKTVGYDLHVLPGEGLFFIKDRSAHVLRRKIWNRALGSAQALSNYQPMIQETTRNLVDCMLQRSDKHGTIDLRRCFPQWAFDTTNKVFFADLAFDTEFSLLASDDPMGIAREARTYLAAFEFFSHLPSLFYLLKAIPGSSKFRKFEAIAIAAARRRMEAKPSLKDVWSYWIDKDVESHLRIDEGDLAIETETALIGGSDTVGSMTIFLFYFVLSNPQWHGALQLELDRSLGEDAHDLPQAKLDALPVLNAVIQETFRLGMVFSGLPRITPAEGATIDGHYLPGGTTVSVPIFVQHTDEQNFENPDVFDPQRWLDGKAPRGALLTFGAGPFNCVGMKLAYMMMRIVTASVFLNLDLKLKDGFDPGAFWEGIGNLRSTFFERALEASVQRRKIFPTTPSNA